MHYDDSSPKIPIAAITV
jgi:carboxypeptidase Q